MAELATHKVGGESGRLITVAAFFDVSPQLLGRCFSEYNGKLRITIATARLGISRADQVRTIALLLTAGRQIGNYDPGPTSASHVREECGRHDVLDTNFSSYIRQLCPILTVKKDGRRLAFDLTPSGYSRAKGLLTRCC